MARRSETMQAAWVSVSTDHGMGRRPLTRPRTCSATWGRVSAALSQQRRLRTGVRASPACALPNITSTTTGVWSSLVRLTLKGSGST
eukprot:8145744-Alexandrium_andersonii.AAC.1